MSAQQWYQTVENEEAFIDWINQELQIERNGIPSSIEKILLTEVLGYEGAYFATDDGRILAAPNASRSTARWLKQSTSKTGYKYVCLSRNGVPKNHYVHRLVLIAFSGGDAAPLQVNHMNGVKSDNRLSNLEWVTASRNRKHAFEIGIQVVSDKQRTASSRNIRRYMESKRSVK